MQKGPKPKENFTWPSATRERGSGRQRLCNQTVAGLDLTRPFATRKLVDKRATLTLWTLELRNLKLPDNAACSSRCNSR